MLLRVIKLATILLKQFAESFFNERKTKFTISFFCTLILLIFSQNTYAYKGINECELLKQEMRKSFTKLALDEPYRKVEERFGYQYDWYDDGTIRITSIHADLYDSLFEQDLKPSDLIGATVVSLNDIPAQSISEESFQSIHDANTLKVVIENSDQEYILKKLEYEVLEVSDAFVDIKTLSTISSQSASFDTVFDLHMSYKDPRLISLAQEVSRKIKNLHADSDGSFFCAIKFSDFGEKLFLPVVKPDRFTPNIDETEMSIEFHYSAPQNDFLCSDEGWGCSDYELKNGIAYYDTKKMYSGTISDFYNFTEFPFDKQILRVALIPDHVANHLMQVDLIQGFTGYNVQQTNLTNFQDVSAAGDEWSFTDAWTETNTFYNPINDQNMPFLAYDYLAERKVGYYVYKLIIPIVFLILLSWVTFFIKINELNSRVTISIVCFLSLIAYNFVVDDNLPKLTYLTFMDKFILISYIFSGIPTIQTVFVEYLSVQKKTNLSFKLDRLFRNYFLAAYLAVISVTSLTSGLFLFN